MSDHERFDMNTTIEKTYRIGEMAAEFDVTLRTLRFYEDKGLLSPRRIGNTRLYSRGDRARLKIILLGKRLGFSLTDISEILALYNPQDGNLKQLTFSVEKGEEQLINLVAERDKLNAAIKELEDTIAQFRSMIAEARKG